MTADVDHVELLGLHRGTGEETLIRRLVVVSDAVLAGTAAPVAGAGKPVFIPLGFGSFVDAR